MSNLYTSPRSFAVLAAMFVMLAVAWSVLALVRSPYALIGVAWSAAWAVFCVRRSRYLEGAIQ